MSSIILPVQIQVGTNADEAFRDMIRLARMIDGMVTTTFNGVHVYVSANDDVDDLMQRMYCAYNNKLTILPVRDTRNDR